MRPGVDYPGLPLVKNLFHQVPASCVRMGMASFSQISLDRSKIEANASKHSSMLKLPSMKGTTTNSRGELELVAGGSSS